VRPDGIIGETAVMVETDVGIGDVWRWGDAVLQVCQPRWPCCKLAFHDPLAEEWSGPLRERLAAAG
jgi:hypothetical protein